ncbi:MAG: LytR C-terminal domain-containing protein [Syntrophaceae bacterium]
MGTFLKTVLVLVMVVSFLGCASVKKDNSGCQQMLRDVHQDLVQCRGENAALAKAKDELAVVKKEEQAGIKRLQNENIALSLQVKELQDQLDKSKKDAAIAAVEKKIAAQGVAQSPAKASAPAAAKSKNRIKVLYGNGKPASAKKLSAKLSSLGYKVEKTGSAARSNYRHNMVYYAKDAKPAAQKLAKQLKAESKPLTWKSEFNIVVVAGGK